MGKSPCFFAVVVCASVAHDNKEREKKTWRTLQMKAVVNTQKLAERVRRR